MRIKILLLALACLIWTGDASAEQNVVVVLDDSGSMGELMRTARGRVRRIDAAKQALSEVLANLPTGTNVGVIALNTQVGGSSWIVPLGPADRRLWQPNIEKITADGGTPLGAYLKRGADELLVARAKRIYGTYRLLVVTDGEANDQNLIESYLPDVLSRGVIVDVIGVDMQSDHSLARRAHSYRRADDDSSLTKAISEVFAETSVNDQDTTADFEMLAALPNEFATEAIKVLTHRNDTPIGGGEFSGDFASTYGPGRSNVPNQGGGRNAGSGFLGLICCLSPFVVLAALAVVLLNSRRPRRKP